MLNNLHLNFKAASICLKLALITSGSFSYRVKVIPKYFSFYKYHTIQQQKRFQQNLKYIAQIRENSYENQIKTLYEKYLSKLKTKAYKKTKQLKQKDKSEYEKQVQGLLHKGMQYLSLYYQSLQNMIQGRRQVLYDEKFKFQDGQTVDQKRIKFQKYLSKLLGRNKQQMEKLQEQYERKRQAQKQKQFF